MFRKKSRPKGLEFASCKTCNGGTTGADAVAALFARLSPTNNDNGLIFEAIAHKGKLAQIAPGVLEEFFRPIKTEQILLNQKGILRPFIKIHADGPRTKAYLSVFAAKFGMAMYREHVGEALPMEGRVMSLYYLNAGLAEDTARVILNMLPGTGGLQQGSFNAAGQFGYRFNCDNKSIVASLAAFHSNLWIFSIATSQPNLYFPSIKDPFTAVTAPGELLKRLA